MSDSRSSLSRAPALLCRHPIGERVEEISSPLQCRMSTDPYPTIRWQEAGVEHVVRWRSEAGVAAPEMVVVADDTLKADAAYRLAAKGTAILWRGDYQHARNLLQALARRVDRGPREGSQKKQATPAAAFHRHRQAQGRRAAILGRLLVPLTADYRVPLRRGCLNHLYLSEGKTI